MRAAALLVTSSTIFGSQWPAPAASVSAAWLSQLSSAPTAAAMPPCAQALEPDVPGWAAASTMAGNGASLSAVKRPARPAPRISAPGASMMLSTVRAMSCGFLQCGQFDREHAVDRLLRPRRDFRVDGHFDRHGLERVQDLVERDALHVRAQIAGAHEFEVRVLGGDVVAHRAF